MWIQTGILTYLPNDIGILQNSVPNIIYSQVIVGSG